MFCGLHSYRKLALKFHPDKNQEPIAPDKFRQTGEAFDVLSDGKFNHCILAYKIRTRTRIKTKIPSNNVTIH